MGLYKGKRKQHRSASRPLALGGSPPLLWAALSKVPLLAEPLVQPAGSFRAGEHIRQPQGAPGLPHGLLAQPTVVEVARGFLLAALAVLDRVLVLNRENFAAEGSHDTDFQSILFLLYYSYVAASLMGQSILFLLPTRLRGIYKRGIYKGAPIRLSVLRRGVGAVKKGVLSIRALWDAVLSPFPIALGRER